MRLVQISDLHFGAIAQGTVSALGEAVERAGGDLVVVSGDLTLAGREREYVEARAFLDTIRGPMLVVPGNHDVPAYDPVERFTQPLGRYKRHIGREVDPVWISRGGAVERAATGPTTGTEIVVLGLNTARAFDFSWNWSHGRFSRSQVRRADRVFERYASAPLKVLVMHHPFVVPDNLPGFRRVGRAERMLGVLAARRVDLVLSGHLHQGFWKCHEIEVQPRGWRVLVIQASTATSSRRREHANAFNQIDIDGHELVLTPWEWGGEAFVPGSASRFVRDECGWTPVEGPAVKQTTVQEIEAPAPAA